MGMTYQAKCNACGSEFPVDDGGGFSFHMLRCDTCGATKSIGFDKLGDLHLRYLKGLSGPYCVASADHDRAVRENFESEPIGREQYHAAVEKKFRRCKCGGRYRFDAPPRCPDCRSTDIVEGDVTMCYD